MSGDAGLQGSASASNGGSSGSGGTASGGSAAGGATCCPPGRDTGRLCCQGQCVNPSNDPTNCGDCGRKCTSGTYCTNGSCVAPPCSASCTGGATCCGTECCTAGELCCDPQGPISNEPGCVALTPNDQGTCPPGCAPLCFCTSPDTPIATPLGERSISSLEVGDLVYSVDGGMLKLVPILRTNRTAVSAHHVMRVTLATGAVLEISAGHPTADGRDFGSLRPDDQLDGVLVTAALLVPYKHEATYDILPDSDTGAYFAGGVLIGSTLSSGSSLVVTPTSPAEVAAPTCAP